MPASTAIANRSRPLGGVALMLALVVPAAAQTVTATTGAINGRVTDHTGAIVPGATVSLSGPSLTLMTPRLIKTASEVDF